MKIIVTLLVAMLLAVPAYAARCIPTENAIRALTENYQEELVSEERRPLEGGDETLYTWQLWAHPETGAWTLVVSNGPITCLSSYGTGYNGQSIGSLLSTGEPT